jgi:hypothetical protein
MNTPKTALQVDCPFCPARTGIACRIGKGSYTRVGGYLVHVQRSAKADGLNSVIATKTPVQAPTTGAPATPPQPAEGSMGGQEDLAEFRAKLTRAALSLSSQAEAGQDIGAPSVLASVPPQQPAHD